MHQKAIIPDILTCSEGLASRIQAEGGEAIPQEQRVLSSATFGLNVNFPPTALLHGDVDVMVEFAQSEGAAKKLKDIGVSVFLETAKGISRGFDVRELPSDINLSVESEQDPETYHGLRRILTFLDDAVLKK